MTAALEIRELSRSFGALRALDGVSLTVGVGETRGLIGPNGAGKSTLFNVVCGAMPPSSGTIHLFGEDATTWRAYEVGRSGVQRTFQGTRPIQHLSVFENAMIGAYRHGSSGVPGAVFRTRRARREEAEARGRVNDLIEQLGLTGVAGRLPGSLSAGQRRLLEICRALAAQPRLLLLDEPAAGLSRAETAQLEERLSRLKSEGISCVLVEHDVELVLRLCDIVTVLDYGRVLAEGPPAQIRTSPEVIDAYIGTVGNKTGVATKTGVEHS